MWLCKDVDKLKDQLSCAKQALSGLLGTIGDGDTTPMSLRNHAQYIRDDLARFQGLCDELSRKHPPAAEPTDKERIAKLADKVAALEGKLFNLIMAGKKDA